MKRSSKASFEPECIGSTVVGERGQIVIPKEIRDNLKLKTGAKLLVIQHHGAGIMLMPAEQMRSFLQQMTKKLTNVS
jgi:AbrB family looped-hinge helix DNA binding protein